MTRPQIPNHPNFNCEKNSVSIWDGEDNTATKLAKFCGEDLPKMLQSSDNSITIRFESEGVLSNEVTEAVDKNLFQLSYFSQPFKPGIP